MNLPYNRSYNFSSGPAALPLEVLERVRDELMNYKTAGASVMEISHRSKEFDEIMANVESLSKELMGLGDEHAVLFLQGGASTQFSMVPINLALLGQPVDVVHTGYWTEMAIAQLKKGVEFSVVASGEGDGFRKLPAIDATKFHKNASYVHMCSNNTIYGTQWHEFDSIFKAAGDVPIVADMSSDLLSRKIDFKKFGLIFAGAQKNLGPSGVCMVVIRKDLAERAKESLPTMLQYRTHIKAGSRYNTPAAFGIYVCGLVLEWLKKQGGVEAMEKKNVAKAKVLYDAIDASGFYQCPNYKSDRSLMNVVFRIKSGTSDSERLEAAFVAEAKKAGLVELKGHRATGGLRASIYNAMPLEGVQALTTFMREFEKRNG